VIREELLVGETEDLVDAILAETDEAEESEEDLGKVDPSLVNKAVVTGTDWTADTILGQLKKGNIVLDPAFQFLSASIRANPR
jgi:hypothetical protein